MGKTHAGWYPDPAGTGQQRYFDGTNWGPMAPSSAGPSTPGSITPPPKKPASLGKVLGIVAVLAVCAGLISMCGSNDTKSNSSSTSSSTSAYVPSAPTTPTYTTQDYEDAAISTCQKAIKNGLKDPDSAKFGDDWKGWKITAAKSTPPDGVAYNPAAGDLYFNAGGSVNAKNSFGGYVGDQPYYCDVVINTAGNVHAVPHNMEDILNPTPTP